MDLKEMQQYLSAHSVEEGTFYTIAGLGGGEIDGIEKIGEKWFTYYSERGKKRGFVEHASEAEACAYVAKRAEQSARRLGLWRD
jgi:hypothetical protein